MRDTKLNNDMSVIWHVAPSSLTREHYIFLLVLTFIPFAMIIIALPFLPDTIPQQIIVNTEELRTSGEVSKYVMLAFPSLFTTTGLFMIWLTRHMARANEAKGKRNGMGMFWLSVATKVFLILLTLWLVIYVHSYSA